MDLSEQYRNDYSQEEGYVEASDGLSSRIAPLVTIIIPHLNEPKNLARCLQALELQRDDRLPFEVIVVDNGSREMPSIECALPDVRLVRETIPGPGPARNRGATLARADLLAFIDCDCFVDEGWLAGIIEHFAREPDLDVIGGEIRIAADDPSARTALEAYEDIYSYRARMFVERDGYAATGNMAVRTAVFGVVGAFEGIGVYEDMAWGRKAGAAGHRIAFVPDVRVFTPACATFAELSRRLDRLVAHGFHDYSARRAGRMKWRARTAMMFVSPLLEIGKILLSDRVSGLRERRMAFSCLVRARLYRTRRMLALTSGGDGHRLVCHVEPRGTGMTVSLRDSQLPRSAMCRPVSVVVVTYNSAEVIGGLLDSLSLGLDTIDDAEVVVVDNASRDGSVAIARAHPIGARVVETGRNGGYAAGINAAAATIAPERDVLILNPDIRLFARTAATLSAALVRDTTIGVVVPRMLHVDGSLAHSIRREPSLVTAWADALFGGTAAGRLGVGETASRSSVYTTGGAVDWATGAALLVSASVRAAVGDWDESFFLYGEEVDYMRRVREAGLRVVYEPAASVVHIGGERDENPRLFSLLTQNRIRDFARRRTVIATALFRSAVVVGELIRSARSPAHRAALRAALAARLEPSDLQAKRAGRT